MSAPDCPPPDPRPRGPRRFAVPSGAVDTHAHVIGAPPAHPYVAGRSYTPHPATPEAYIAMLDATGMTRGVLVQVSVHGTDNRLMQSTVAAHRGRLRGIAVLPPDLPDARYAAAKADGIVGLRLNVLYGGGIGFDALADYAALARELGWHLQFLIDVRALAPMAARIVALVRDDVPFVIDHMGHFPTDAVAPDEAAFATLVALVRDGGWVKLSGAYRLSHAGAPWADTGPYARRLVEAAPARCLWGSDWPHVAHVASPMMNVGELLDTLADWVPDAATRDRILVDNPARLYGFGSHEARGGATR